MSTDIALVLGTRPEIIKLAPVIRACERRDIEYTLIHTGQHYSEELDQVFFDQLELPTPDYNLHVGSKSHGQQTGEMITGIEEILRDEKPEVVFVQGDTNSVLAGAIATDKMDIELAHVEAGLRSFDMSMPEESNRRMVDHISDYLFAPTDATADLLREENIDEDRIFVTGNTVVDTVMQNQELAATKSRVLSECGLTAGEYALMTAHRAENVDNERRFADLLDGVAQIARKFDLEVVYPIHPRAEHKLEAFDIEVPTEITLIDPQDYLDFLNLERNARLILTDSGGVQEEACILGVPCITLRDNTERPETIEVGANTLVGTSPDEIVGGTLEMLNAEVDWDNPFGDGTAAEQMLSAVGFGDSADLLSPSDTATMTSETICVHGLGYIGLPTAVMFATAGFDIIGFDINEEIVSSLQDQEAHFDEPGLQSLVSETIEAGTFRPTTELEPADYHIICVPTPFDSDTKEADLRYVEAAGDSVASQLRPGDMVILESTVPPQTTMEVLKPVLETSGLTAGRDFDLAHCPETVLPGNMIEELTGNDRIIGGIDSESTERAVALYNRFVNGEIRTTDDATAVEFVKLIQNTFRDTNIALANELAKIAHDYDIDAREAIPLANSHPRVNIHHPGPGVGGHCLPVDPWFLGQHSDVPELIEHARQVNNGMADYIVDLLESRLGSLSGATIAIMGVAYKGNVGDHRESPGLHLAEQLQQYAATESTTLATDGGQSTGADSLDIRLTDPHVIDPALDIQPLDQALTGADALVVATDHDEYTTLSPSKIARKMKGSVVIDAKGIFDADVWSAAGLDVSTI